MPVTKALMVCAVLTMLLAVFGADRWLGRLVFTLTGVIQQPWSLVTYPLVSPRRSIGVLFAVIWLWFVGGSLERSWGSRRYGIFFAWVSLLTAVGAGAAGYLAGKDAVLMGLWVPLAPLTVAWAALNPEAQVLFYFIIPLRAKYLAWITVAFLYLYQGVAIHPFWGLLILLGCAAAYYQVSRPRRYRSSGPNIRGSGFDWRRLDPIERLRDWQRRRSLRRLFRDSGYDENRQP